MISRIQQFSLMMAAALATLSVIAVGATTSTQEAYAARLSCEQDGPGDSVITVEACVNANVEKNNICVGVIAESVRCQTD
jgi:hypothetical protein